MTVTFHPRSTLGLGAPVLARLDLRSPAEVGPAHEGLTWHHVGAGGNLFHPDPIARLQGIWRYHVEVRGYGDIAYGAAFDADGNTFELRDHRYIAAHASSTGNVANRLTDGVCFLEDARGITHAALEAFTWWVNVYHLTMGRVPQSFAHEWWAYAHGGTPTECPGTDWVGVLRALKANV